MSKSGLLQVRVNVTIQISNNKFLGRIYVTPGVAMQKGSSENKMGPERASTSGSVSLCCLTLRYRFYFIQLKLDVFW